MGDKECVTRTAARVKNAEGEKWMIERKYTNALYAFSKAIELYPNQAKYYINRTSCYLEMNDFIKAQKDAEMAIVLDPNHLKGYTRLMKCFLATGDLRGAENTLQKANTIFPGEKELEDISETINYLKEKYKECQLQLEKKRYENALLLAEKCTAKIPNCLLYNYAKIKCLIFLQKYYEAEQIASYILTFRPTDENALYYKYCANCYKNDVEVAVDIIKQLKSKLSDHEKTNELYKNTVNMNKNIKQINCEIEKQNYQEAYNLMKKTIAIDPNYVKTVHKLRLKKIEIAGKNSELLWDGIVDCNDYLRIYGFDLEILKICADYEMRNEEYDDAIDDYEKILKYDKSPVYLRYINEAKILFEKQKTDHYKVLRISKNATDIDIKKAVQKLQKRYHPEKNNKMPKDRIKRLEEKFVRVQAAEKALLKTKKHP